MIDHNTTKTKPLQSTLVLTGAAVYYGLILVKLAQQDFVILCQTTVTHIQIVGLEIG